MIPTSLTTFGVFLLLVVPGIVFEIVYEQRRPPRQTTVFREVCNIVLIGTVSSLVSIGLLLAIEIWQPNLLINLDSWTRSPHAYELNHAGRIFVMVIFVAAISCALSWTLAKLLEIKRGDIRNVGFSPNTAIYNAVHSGAKDKDSKPQLQVETTRGAFIGMYEFLDPFASKDEGWLVLRDVHFVVGDEKRSIAPWQRVAIPFSEITSVLTRFTNA